MKKLLVAGNVLLLVLLLMAHTVERKPVPDNLDRSVQLGIDPNLSRSMLVEYRDKIWRNRNINGGLGKDARSVWFSLAKLKAFIADIESKVGQHCTDSFNLGIRIYYAAYPDSSMIRVRGWKNYLDNHKLPMEYRNHHTVVMVPTYWNNEDGHYYDFDPRFRTSPGLNNCNFSPVADVMNALLSPSIDNNGPGRFFNDSYSLVPRKESFMIMPDNLDSRRFRYGYNPEVRIQLPKKSGGGNSFSSYLPPPPPSDFTNGGTLIPPPYPDPTEGGSNRPAGNSGNGRNKSMFQRIHVPSSGASYMRWVDNTNDTGWVNKPLDNYDARTEINKIQ